MAHAAKNPSIRLEGPDGDGIATVWIDCQDKKVNTLSVDLMPEFTAVFGKISADPRIKAIVIASGKETGFIAGADIDDLGLVRTAVEGAKLSKNAQDAFRNLEKLGIPTVAAIHGDCLGGGLELALACTARVVSDHRKTKLALPEVMLGLLPGGGGTVRLPKLIGLANALDMMLTGKNIRPSKALKLGLVDAAVPAGKLLESARKLAVDLAHGKPAHAKKKQSRRRRCSPFIPDRAPSTCRNPGTVSQAGGLRRRRQRRDELTRLLDRQEPGRLAEVLLRQLIQLVLAHAVRLRELTNEFRLLASQPAVRRRVRLWRLLNQLRSRTHPLRRILSGVHVHAHAEQRRRFL